MRYFGPLLGIAISLAAMAAASGALAEEDDERASDLARKVQNPIADLISLPLQDNTNTRQGPYYQTGNILNIQPVIPFHLNSNWNLITRTILPLVSQVRLSPTQGPEYRLGICQASV